MTSSAATWRMQGLTHKNWATVTPKNTSSADRRAARQRSGADHPLFLRRVPYAVPRCRRVGLLAGVCAGAPSKEAGVSRLSLS
jgi:hypothetical protein